jgi:MFS family permease
MPRRTNERVALAVATLASFLTPFMGSATNVALPAIGPEMRLDAVALTWVATAYLLSAAVFLRFSVMSTHSVLLVEGSSQTARNVDSRHRP